MYECVASEGPQTSRMFLFGVSQVMRTVPFTVVTLAEM